jgi:hypothetical protein
MTWRTHAALGAVAFLASPPLAHPVLFLDNHGIAAEKGLRRVVHHPVKHGPPLVGPLQHNAAPFMTVMRLGGRYRMYFNSLIPGRAMYVSYVESPDGVHFSRRPTNLDIPNIEFGATVVRAPDGHLVLGWWQDGVWTAVSRNGGNRFIHAEEVLHQTGPAENDILSMTYFRGRYIAMLKLYKRYAHGGRTAPPHTRRVVGVATSPNARDWTKPRIVLAPDRRDPGVTEFYGVGGMIDRGGVLVGMLRILRDDIGRGIGYTTLAWSRDGVTWHRYRAPFLTFSADRRKWDSSAAWADSQIVARGRTMVYYGGYHGGHKANNRHLGLATLAVDRYVSRTGTGILETRPVRIDGLALNATVRGSVVVDLVRGRRVVSSCRVPRGDYVYERVCPVIGTYRVRLLVRDADVYGVS